MGEGEKEEEKGEGLGEGEKEEEKGEGLGEKEEEKGEGWGEKEEEKGEGWGEKEEEGEGRWEDVVCLSLTGTYIFLCFCGSNFTGGSPGLSILPCLSRC